MMSSDQDLLNQADRFMRRHRVFVAGSTTPAAHAAASDSADDLPILTELVEPEELQPAEPEPEPDPGPSLEELAQVAAHELLLQRLAAQRNAIEKEVIAWLDKELPQIVQYVVEGLTDQLVAQVTGAMRLELLPKLQLAVEAEETQPSQDGATA